MSIKIGSYNNGLYNLSIINDKLVNLNKINNQEKVSYLINYLDSYAYLYLKDGIQYIKIDQQDLKLGEGACHISYDQVNELIYVSFYGAGLLKVLKKNNSLWKISETISYGKNSHIHFAKYIDSQNVLAVCDLGLNKVLLYRVVNNKLELVNTYNFTNNEGPRHFIEHPTLPFIYVMNELNPSVTTLEISNNNLSLVNHIDLGKGSGSAIRMDKLGKFLYVAVRDSNEIIVFKILKKGLLEIVQKVQTYGDHPRDFNLVYNDKYLLVANMKSDNLTLFEIKEGKLNLLEKDFYFLAGCTII